MANKHILLISYAYPPNIAIGARRWAKTSKYLALMGYTIHVITAKSFNSKGNNWINDVSHKNIKVSYIDDNQTKWLREGYVKKNDYVKRLIRKIYITYLEYFKGGLWMDEARFMKENILTEAKSIIEKHKIRNIISTGPPFNINYYTAQLKNWKSDLNIMCDFRDSWTDAKNYAYENIPKYVVKEEERKQKYTCEKASYLFFTYKEMCNQLNKLYTQIDSKKFIYMQHAYDPHDYNFTNNKIIKSNKIRLIFGGAITMDVCYSSANFFIDSLKQLKQKEINQYKKLDFIFYNQNIIFKKMIQDNSLTDIITFKDYLPEKDFFLELNGADILLAVQGENWKEYITSKLVSYLGFKKPILLVANKGRATDFVSSNHFGFILDNTANYKFWIHLIKDIEKGITKYSFSNIEKFTYATMAKKVSKFLI